MLFSSFILSEMFPFSKVYSDVLPLFEAML
uniref:Uncharacterized protein n=1 Tax=Rhizophora mucronata TaxID=61149 RepID=A0A2P2NDD6_RHIMU